MSETTTTPTPTNEQQDVRFVDFVFSVSSQPPDDAWDEVVDLIDHWAERHGLDVFGIASSHAVYSTGANVPAAAAPDEREAVNRAAVTLAERIDGGAWADYSEDERQDWRGHAAAALAARPAPAVNAADVKRAAAVLLADYQQQYDGGQIEEFLDLARAVARALGLTVADEGGADAPAADDEGGQER